MEGCPSWHSRQKPEPAKRSCGTRFAPRCRSRNSRRSKVFSQSADPTNRSILSEALVETRIYPGQPGLTQDGLTQDRLAQDSSNGGEGVDYLRRLKGGRVWGARAPPPCIVLLRAGGRAPRVPH